MSCLLSLEVIRASSRWELEARAGDDWPRRINVYARKARDFELFCAFHVVCVAGTSHESFEAPSQFGFGCPDLHTG